MAPSTFWWPKWGYWEVLSSESSTLIYTHTHTHTHTQSQILGWVVSLPLLVGVEEPSRFCERWGVFDFNTTKGRNLDILSMNCFFFSLSFSLSLSLFLVSTEEGILWSQNYPSAYLSVCLSIYLSVNLSSTYLLYPSVLSTHLAIHPSIHLFHSSLDFTWHSQNKMVI